MSTSPASGEPAPDVELTDHTGTAVRLSDYWHKSAVVLLFVRHFG